MNIPVPRGRGDVDQPDLQVIGDAGRRGTQVDAQGGDGIVVGQHGGHDLVSEV